MDTILVTGASGLLGSACVVALATAGYRVLAVDRRDPGPLLRSAAPRVAWRVGDCAVPAFLDAVFAELPHGAQVLHLAAHYDFGCRWHAAYQRDNLVALQGLIAHSRRAGVARFHFASSLAVHGPPAPGVVLREGSPGDAVLPYGLSKRRGEDLLAAVGDLPSTVLRIGGVFTAWCELPPLFGLLELWGGPWPLARCLVGRGATAFPYLDRRDFADLILALVARVARLPRQSTLLACGPMATDHAALYAALPGPRPPPRHLPVGLVRCGLHARLLGGWCCGRPPVERPWMLGFVDRPLLVDTTLTNELLGWRCRPERHILARLPELCAVRDADPWAWRRRNHRRNARSYLFDGAAP